MGDVRLLQAGPPKEADDLRRLLGSPKEDEFLRLSLFALSSSERDAERSRLGRLRPALSPWGSD